MHSHIQGAKVTFIFHLHPLSSSNHNNYSSHKAFVRDLNNCTSLAIQNLKEISFVHGASKE